MRQAFARLAEMMSSPNPYLDFFNIAMTRPQVEEVARGLELAGRVRDEVAKLERHDHQGIACTVLRILDEEREVPNG